MGESQYESHTSRGLRTLQAPLWPLGWGNNNDRGIERTVMMERCRTARRIIFCVSACGRLRGDSGDAVPCPPCRTPRIQLESQFTPSPHAGPHDGLPFDSRARCLPPMWSASCLRSPPRSSISSRATRRCWPSSRCGADNRQTPCPLTRPRDSTCHPLFPSSIRSHVC